MDVITVIPAESDIIAALRFYSRKGLMRLFLQTSETTHNAMLERMTHFIRVFKGILSKSKHSWNLL